MIHCRRNTFLFVDESVSKSLTHARQYLFWVVVGPFVGNGLIFPRRQWPTALLTAAFAQHVHMVRFARLAGLTLADCTSIKCLSRPDHSRELLTGLFHLQAQY